MNGPLRATLRAVRNSSARMSLVGLCLGLGVGCAKSSSSPTPTGAPDSGWSVADLGPGRCVGINPSGQVVGVDAQNVTFVISATGALTALADATDGGLSVGLAIASNGDVLGYQEGSVGRSPATSTQGSWKPLAGLSGRGAATAVDAEGDVVGFQSANGPKQAFLLSAGKPVALPLPVNLPSAAYAVAKGGVVAGIVETPSEETHAFVVAGGRLQDLGTLGGRLSIALGVNPQGDVVGASQLPDGSQHAAFHGASSTGFVDLGLPTGMARSDARGIDDRGRIAGNAASADGVVHAMSFTPGKPAVELSPTSGPGAVYSSTHAAASAPDGHIVGWGSPVHPGSGEAAGAAHCLVWTPVN